MIESDQDPFRDAPVIFRYTRHQAIEDGVLVDLTEWAQEIGIKFPVACTAAVWSSHIVPPDKTRQFGQSERGRAHDLLWMLLNKIRRTSSTDSVFFEVIFLMSAKRYVTVTFKALCGPGDDGEPVITIMMREED